MAPMELKDVDVKKLQTQVLCKKRVTVAWLNTDPLYVEHFCWGTGVFSVYVDHNPGEDHPDSGRIETNLPHRMMVFVDVLNKFGDRSYSKRAGESGSHGVSWRIAPAILMTTLRLLDKNLEELERITKKARTPKQFLALAAII